MALRSRSQGNISLGRPSTLSYLPANFGQDSGIDNLMKGINDISSVLSERKKKEDDIKAREALAKFEVQQRDRLNSMDLSAENNSRIDLAFKRDFEQNQKLLLDSAENDSQRDILRSRLPQLFVELQSSAMKAEVVRNNNAMDSALDGTLDAYNNALSTNSNPEAAVAKYQTQYAEAIAEAGAQGVYSRPKQVEKLREGKMAINASMVTGLIHNDPFSAKKRLVDGEFDKMITDEAKTRLLNRADEAIRGIEADIKSIRREAITEMNKEITNLEQDLSAGYRANTAKVKSMAEAVGGPEGARAMLQAQLFDIYGQRVSAFAQRSYAEREAILGDLTVKRNSGKLSREETDLMNLLLKTHNSIDESVKRDGYSQALKSRVISESVPLTERTMGKREDQATTIREAFGPDASVMTPAEVQGIVEGMETGSVNDQINLINQFANAPQLRRQLFRELAGSNDKRANSFKVAFELGAMGNPEIARRILQGIRLIKSDTPMPTPDVWTAAQNKAFGTAFTGMEDIAAAYRDAGIAHYFASRPPGSITTGDAITSDDLAKSMQEVMPGWLVDAEGDPANTGWVGGSPALLTPSKKITPEMFRTELANLQSNTEWWKKTKWFNDITGEYDPVLSNPTYPDGKLVDPITITPKNLRMVGQGLYVLTTDVGYIAENGNMLVLDLRDMQ